MECSEKQYQLLQNYNFNEPTTSAHERYEIIPNSVPITLYQSSLLSSSADVNQVTSLRNSSLSNYHNRTTLVDGTKSRRNLGYSVYAENFNKLLQRGPCASRKKSTILFDGEEEGIVYCKTEANEHYGIETESGSCTKTITELQQKQSQTSLAQLQGSSNKISTSVNYCSSDNTFPSINLSPHKVTSFGKMERNLADSDRFKTKPAISYATLVALALKNSKNGCLTVQEVYDFVDSNFPFFRTANSGWKNSVRHNLSFSKYFMKIETRRGEGDSRRSYIWTVNPARSHELEQSLNKLMERDKENTLKCLANPDDFDAIRNGTLNFKFKRPVRRKPMVQVGSKESVVPRTMNAGSSQQEGKKKTISNLASNVQYTYSNTAQKIHTLRGPRRVLSFGATPTGGISEASQGFSISCSEDSTSYGTRPLPELTRILNENDDDSLFCQSSQGSPMFTVMRYQSSPEICTDFEGSTTDFVEMQRSDLSVSNNFDSANMMECDNNRSVQNECQGIFHSSSQLSFPEIHVETQIQLTPPPKMYSEDSGDLSNIVSPGNDVMLSDAIINRSPEQDLKLPAFEQWQYEPVTPSRWTDFGGQYRTPQCKISRSHLLV